MKINSRGRYLSVIDPAHPMADSRGRILMHRYVMAQHLGRSLLQGEIVHHKDENPRNNDLGNLVLTDALGHAKEHPQEKRLATKVCAYCGIEVTRAARTFNKDAKRFFCCIPHSTLFYQREARGGAPEVFHGTQLRYKRGCRCSVCRAGHNKRMREWRIRKRERSLG